jgi:hypothetical protein
VPTRWLSEEESKNGICFICFDMTIAFNQWQAGRIFDSKKEFLWQMNNDGQFQVIYTGEEMDLPELNLINEDWQDFQTSYLLWGRSLNSTELKSLRIQEDTTIFLELQLPRLLNYPVAVSQDKKHRLRLNIIEYKDKETGCIQHYRFHSLGPANESI